MVAAPLDLGVMTAGTLQGPGPMLARRIRGLNDLLSVTHDAVRRLGLRYGLPAVQAVRRAGRPGDEVDVQVPGLAAPLRLRAGTSDAATFVQIFLRGDLDFPLDAEPRTIVDGGANIGLSALYLARRFPQARIIAVEFEASNFAQLLRNVARSPLIEPVHAGLWPTDGSVQVANAHAAKWAFFPTAGGRAGASHGVRAVSISTLMSEHAIERIDLLKLDIEGSEWDLFADPQSRWLDRVGTLAIELHDALRPGAAERVLRAVSRRSFTLRVSGEYLVFGLNPAGGR
jgi:FkbM family methyltransferase